MLIIAHRGASDSAPENTLAAVRLAWAEGADALEVDVHLTRDGRLAAIHDPDTQRTTGVPRIVAEATLAELQQLDAGRWKDGRFAGERIPALDDVLALVPPTKQVFIELKSGPEAVDALVHCIEQARTGHRLACAITVITFSLPTAEEVARACPGLEVCWIVDAGADAPESSLDAIVARAHRAGLSGIDVSADWPLSVKFVQQARTDGFKLYVWTVDDPRLARHLAAVGVDGLTTNRPGWLRAQLAGAR